MDPALYKQHTTTRGLKYNYFAAPGDAFKPTLLFVHGFPSTSYDWRLQVAFFKNAGYSIIVPDLLGYGSTDKPTDPALYKYSVMCADIVEILDLEGARDVIAIGHDWGSILTSRLAVFHKNRFLAFAFLAVGYSPSAADFDYEKGLALTKQALGYETLGYWQFFCEDGADRVIKDHSESFLSIVHAADPQIWKTDFCPSGALKACLTADKQCAVGSYLSDKDKGIFKQNVDQGLGGALNWYRIMLLGIAAEDSKNIAEPQMLIEQPVFFGEAKHDAVAVPRLYLPQMQKLCTNLTVREYDCGHWVHLVLADDVNSALADWISGMKKPKL